MGFGLGVLKLSPAAFWGMTLRELAAALRALLPAEAERLGRARLGELMRRFPDE